MIWFFAVLSPTLIVPLPTEEISERRLYVPLAAVAPFFVVGLFSTFGRLGKDQSDEDTNRSSRSVFRGPFISSQLAILAIVVFFTVLSIRTMPRLSRKQFIWEEVLKHQPDNAFAFFSQGCVEYNLGDKAGGIQKMLSAFYDDPGYQHGVITLAKALEDTGQQEKLVDLYRDACDSIPIKPELSPKLHSLAKDAWNTT